MGKGEWELENLIKETIATPSDTRISPGFS